MIECIVVVKVSFVKIYTVRKFKGVHVLRISSIIGWRKSRHYLDPKDPNFWLTIFFILKRYFLINRKRSLLI